MGEKSTPEGLRQKPENLSGTKPNPESQQEKKESPKFGDLRIVTSTLYKGGDEVTRTRMATALESFRRASELGIKCCVLDGGSDPAFLDELKKFDNLEVTVDPKPGIGASRREAFEMALKDQNTQFFLNLEPEKTEVINGQSLEQIITMLRENQADMVVLNRKGLQDKDSRASKSMVPLQRWFEIRANKRANKLLQVDQPPLDIWFSVEMMNRKGAQYFVNYKGPLDKWDAMVAPILNAHKDGKKVTGVDIDFAYEGTQTGAEQKDRNLSEKRLRQYTQILAAIDDPHWKEKLKGN